MKKTLMCLLVLSATLAGCVIVPVGRPWHHDYVERGYGWDHDGGRR